MLATISNFNNYFIQGELPILLIGADSQFEEVLRFHGELYSFRK